MKPTKETNSDAWPCPVLNEAVVYRKSKDGQLIIANVCNVDLEGPFVVRGQLDIELEQMDLRTFVLSQSFNLVTKPLLLAVEATR